MDHAAGDVTTHGDGVLERLTQLRALDMGLARLRTLIDLSAAHPLLQRHRVDPEVLRDLLNGHAGLAVSRDAHNVVTELRRVRLRLGNILPGLPVGQARSDFTY
nr:hypothetical protein [Microbacterium barkeri]